jgi:hypothetical protein
MKVCDLNSGLGQLSHAFSRLKDRLAETKSDWNDGARRQFEQNHLSEIPARMQLLIAAVQRLSEVLEKAERDCEDRPEHL